MEKENKFVVRNTSIYILADNIISSLGFDTASNIAKISAEKSHIACHDDTQIYPVPFWASRIDEALLSQRINSIDSLQNYSKLEQLFLLSINDVLFNSNIDITNPDTLLIFASTKGNIDLLEHKNHGKFPKERILLAEMAKQVQSYFQNPNEPIVVCNACISGVLAMDVAKRLLRQGKYKNIIVTGGDLVSEFTVSGFQSFKAMSDAPCRPYDRDRVGINLGEGIGTVVLSTTVPQTDTVITLEGGASSNDANHISGPSRTGDGLHIAIEKALKDAGTSGTELDYLSMHGTATPYNDEMESKAITLSKLNAVPMNSLKGYFGHTLGAAGLIESIVAIHSLKNNTLYRSLGFDNLGVPHLLNVITKTEEKELNVCLKTASGFGGCNAAMVFAKNKKQENTIPSTDMIETTVVGTCEIKANRLIVNDTVIYQETELPFAKFIKGAYKHLGLKYPKFHKMDRLCKLAFVAANNLLGADGSSEYAPEDIAIVMANRSSTLHTDSKHCDAIKDREDYYPSPAVFVYTLPNIMMGEIAIQYKIKGEGLFLIGEQPNLELLKDYAQNMLEDREAKACLVGWVDYTDEDYYAKLTLLKTI